MEGARKNTPDVEGIARASAALRKTAAEAAEPLSVLAELLSACLPPFPIRHWVAVSTSGGRYRVTLELSRSTLSPGGFLITNEPGTERYTCYVSLSTLIRKEADDSDMCFILKALPELTARLAGELEAETGELAAVTSALKEALSAPEVSAVLAEKRLRGQ